MRPDERIAAGELAGQGFAEAVRSIGDTHAAIAARVFAHVGAGAEPVERAHDAIAGLAYGSTRAIGRAVLTLAGRGAALVAGPDARSIEDSGLGRVALGAVSGVWGDALAARADRLAVEMAVRADGRDLELDPATIADAFVDATPRVAVFLHGLCETEDAWRLGAARSRPYGDRLRDELGYTPIYVRYNTGLHVSENGRLLAGLLAELERDWPVELEQLALVGHSMGGLLARSAYHYGIAAPWTSKVRHVVMLGSPHTGAPLEQGTQALQAALARVPETAPFARMLGARSAGIKDLGRGYLTSECWQGQDPDAFLRHAAREIPFLESASHYFVAASLTRRHDHPASRFIGDLLVLHDSAWGRRRRWERLRFDAGSYRHVGQASHFALLNHPAIAEQLVGWLSPRAELVAETP
jgi:hypothetical protein